MAHAWNRERRFRDIRRDDDFPFVRRFHDGVLRVRRQIAVERQENDRFSKRDFLAFFDRPADFVGAWHEDQNVARLVETDQHADGVSSSCVRSCGEGRLEIDGFNGIETPFRMKVRAIAKIVANGRGVESCGHDDELQIRPVPFIRRKRWRRRPAGCGC